MQRRGSRRTEYTRTRSFFAAACVSSLIVFAAPSARAAGEVPLETDYVAPPECPLAEKFLAEVSARTTVARPARAGDRATKLRVAIREVAGGARGTLELASPDGATSARRVSAADCAQVVSALALMTALAIDPDASTAPATPETERSPHLPPPQLEAPRAPPRPSGRAASPAHWNFRAGTEFEALGGVAPDWLFVVRPALEASRDSATWSSGIRASFGWGREIVTGRAGGAEFAFVDARLEGCPARLFPARSLRIAPCVAFDAGRIQATGLSVVPAQRVEAPWLAPGITARLEWRIVHAIVVEAAGELFFPLARSRFFVGTDTTLHRTPAVTSGAAVGLAASFP